jgi:CBS domain-containing protein
MSVGEHCNREVVIVAGNASVVEAARLMRSYHVGTLVVVETRQGTNVPVGIVTDRDLVVGVVAKEIPYDSVTVGDIMPSELTTAREDESLWGTVDRMCSFGIRRVPVVNEAGGLEGILSMDDILELFAGGLQKMADLVRREMDRESECRKV